MSTTSLWGAVLDQVALAAKTATNSATGGDILLVDIEAFK